MAMPLGRAIGNAIEIQECVEVLKGRGPDDLVELLMALGVRMLTLSGKYKNSAAEQAIRTALSSGAALDKLRAMIGQQGGDVAVVDDYTRLPPACSRHAVVAPQSGYVHSLHAESIGRASMVLGAGREHVEDQIDHGAGVLIARAPGDAVRAGDTVLELLYNDDSGLAQARTLAEGAITIGDDRPVLRPHILGVVR
jgi:thymidine phosphorylase